jgi:hypothetical protein
MALKRLKVPKPTIDRYQAADAANTIARAREHLANKPLMKAVKAHVAGLNAAVTGSLKPKKLGR